MSIFDHFVGLALKELTLSFGFNEDFENNCFKADFILSKFKSPHTVSASLCSSSVILSPSNSLKVKLHWVISFRAPSSYDKDVQTQVCNQSYSYRPLY